MNDFSELENDLKALRPARPSPVLFERIEQAMAEDRKGAVASDATGWRGWYRRFTETPYKFGIGLAAAVAAVLLLLVRVNTEQTPNEGKEIASDTTSALRATPKVLENEPRASGGSGTKGGTFSDRFIPAGATQVVYNTRDEGLHFANGYQQPVRRLRYQTQETCQWRNPSTGASLRVSYPSEEVVLIPVSGQ
jgi:hypothetical protein